MENIINWIKENLKKAVIIFIALIAGIIFYFFSSNQRIKETKFESGISAVSSDESFSGSKSKLTSRSSSGDKSEIAVDLKGAVQHPQVYRVKNDQRLSDLIQMAGGFTAQADRNSINLAAKLKDEQVIYVAQIGENAPAVAQNQTHQNSSALTEPSTTEQSNKVNINTADITQLQTLSGIGAKKAQDIIDYRTQNGNFASVDDLGKISGFGAKTVAKLKESITVDE